MRVAALDLGTNTFLLLVAEVEAGRVTSVVHDEVRIVRLGQEVHQKRQFHPEALARADECLSAYAKTLRGLRVERVLAVATSAARDVSNRDELIKLGAKHGLPIEIISGEREAELTFWGTVNERSTGPFLIIDIGGGSTEFVLGDHSGLIARHSADIGSVRLTEMFVSSHPVQAQEMSAMTGYIQQHLQPVRALFASASIANLIAVAGTPTTLAAMDLQQAFDAEKLEGYQLTMQNIRNWVQRLAQMSVAERQELAGMEPKRADVIVAGSLILMLACQCFDARAVTVSTRGLRYGVARSLSGGIESESN